MFALYSQPTGITWTLQGTAAFVNADGGDPLTNRRPGLGARITWITGAQTTASVTELRATWAASCVVAGIAILGVTLPKGTRVQVLGRLFGGSTFDEDLGADSRIVSRARGERVLVLLLENSAGLDGIAVKFFNDVNSVASIAAGAAFDVGEIFFGEGHEIAAMGGSTLALVDTTVVNETFTGNLFGAAGAQFWELDAQPLFRDGAAIYGEDQEDAPAYSYLKLLTRISKNQACMLVPRHESQHYTNESALFGVVKNIGPLKHRAGRFYQPENLKLHEIPVPV